MHPRLVLTAAVALALTMGSYAQPAGSPLESVDDLGHVPRNALLVFPTRLANVYFPELVFGYRRRLGDDGLWAIGATAGPTFSDERRSRNGLGKIWGFGLGLEARRYWLDSPPPRIDPYFTIGAELSRVYYDSFRGLEPVASTNYQRVVEARTHSKRREALAGLGVDFTAASGFVVDVRLAVAVLEVGYDVNDGDLAPAQVDPVWREPPHSSTQLLFNAREAFVRPRLRIGLGWRW